MPSVEIRPFRRSDRDQLTQLVTAHAAAVVPGMSISVAALLASLERRPGEAIVDPWVSERMTLVAEQQQRVVAAAHLLRYRVDERTGPHYRGLGKIDWLIFWPEAPAGNPHWTDATGAAERLISACVAQLERWAVTALAAEGDLPVPGVYGVPEQWPHVAALYERAGFRHTGHTEIVHLAQVPQLARPGAPLDRLSVRRSVGMNGTRLSAVLDDAVIGYIEVELTAGGERLPHPGGFADVGNLHVAAEHRRRGVGTWLLGQAANWLAMARVDRLLDYSYLEPADPDGCPQAPYRAFLAAAGFIELTRTRRGWTGGGAAHVMT